METSESVVNEHLRPVLAELLEQCTEGQKKKFARIFPDGVDGVPVERIPSTIALVKRTIANNS